MFLDSCFHFYDDVGIKYGMIPGIGWFITRGSGDGSVFLKGHTVACVSVFVWVVFQFLGCRN